MLVRYLVIIIKMGDLHTQIKDPGFYGGAIARERRRARFAALAFQAPRRGPLNISVSHIVIII